MIRHLYERPMAAILATFGVSLILQHGMQLAFGAAPRMVTGPVAGAVGILGTSYPAYRLLLIASAIVILGYSGFSAPGASDASAKRATSDRGDSNRSPDARCPATGANTSRPWNVRLTG